MNAPNHRTFTLRSIIHLIIIPLITLQRHDFASAEVCTVCSNETHIMKDQTAKVIWPPGNNENTALECSDIAAKAVVGFFSNCTILHSYSDDLCECGPKEEQPITCPLCGEGVSLPEPNRFVAGKSCLQWEEYATTEAFEMDCPYYQKSIGTYCGCDISDPNYFNHDGEFCRLCKNEIIPDYNKKVTYVDGTQNYCVNVEVDVNVYSYRYDCSLEQNKYKKACCNGGLEELPTLSPTKNSSGGNSIFVSISSVARILPIVSSILIPVLIYQ
jgi:hypothetical protein